MAVTLSTQSAAGKKWFSRRRRISLTCYGRIGITICYNAIIVVFKTKKGVYYYVLWNDNVYGFHPIISLTYSLKLSLSINVDSFEIHFLSLLNLNKQTA